MKHASAIDAIERQGLPAALELERLVLGSVLHLGAVEVDNLRDAVEDDCFSTEPHRIIWRTITEMREAGDEVILPTLGQRLHDARSLEAIGGFAYLADLQAEGIPGANLDGAIQTLTSKAVLRRTIQALNLAMIRCMEPGADGAGAVEAVAQALERIGDAGTGRGALQSAGEILADTGIEEFCNPSRDSVGAVPLPEKWRALREIVPCLRPGQLATVAAHTSHGKTAFLLDLALCVSAGGAPVGLFSLEMQKSELLQRATCNLAEVDSFNHQNGRLNAEERRRFQRAVSRLAEMPLYLDDRTGSTVAAIAAAAGRMRPKPRLLGVDYLQLLEASGRVENRVQAVSQISRGLKNLAVRMQIPVIVLSQFNRESARAGREPELHDLRDSGSIEQDSNIVLMLHSKPDQESLPFARVDVIVKKNRGGRKGRASMTFEKPYQRFTEAGGAHAFE